MPQVEYPDVRAARSALCRDARSGSRRNRLAAVGRGERQVARNIDAADGHAVRLALGAYRPAQCAAGQGCQPVGRQSGRLGGGARLAVASDGRGRRGAAADRQRRYRSLHAEDEPGRAAVGAGQQRSFGDVPAGSGTGQAGAARFGAGRRDLRFTVGRSASGPRPTSKRPAGGDGSAGSISRWPTRSSARERRRRAR